MKKVAYIFLFFALLSNCFGQSTLSSTTINLLKQSGYALDSNNPDTSVKAFVGFTVGENGYVQNVKILKSCGSAILDNIAVSSVYTMPPFKPATKDGKNVAAQFNLPIKFPLDKKSHNLYRNEKQQEDINKFYNDGVKNVSENKNEEAVENFKKCLTLNPNDIDALYNIGATYLKLNEKNKACENWNKIKLMGKPDADELIKQYCKN